MKILTLPAEASSDLEWVFEECDFVELDFGWGKAPLFIDDEVLFQSHAFAVQQLGHRCPGVILYRGPLAIISSLVLAREEVTSVERATIFGNYLHRLASFLPDEVTAYCLFENCAPFTKGEAAQLMSQDRFWPLELSLVPRKEACGLLLPPDELCSKEVIARLTEILETEPGLRVIPERRLNELWEGLDELIVLEGALSLQGKRQLLGFEAAGGKIRSRGI